MDEAESELALHPCCLPRKVTTKGMLENAQDGSTKTAKHKGMLENAQDGSTKTAKHKGMLENAEDGCKHGKPLLLENTQGFTVGVGGPNPCVDTRVCAICFLELVPVLVRDCTGKTELAASIARELEME